MDEVVSYERRFRRAGLPLFIEGYSATQDVFTRALPFLALVFVVLVLGALNLTWGPLANIAAVAAGLAILFGAFGILNLLRGRPFLSVPKKVGLPELTAFVVLPAILPLVFGGQFRSALVTLAEQLALLGLVFLVVGFGLLSILRWAVVRLFAGLGTSLRLLSRAIPLLLFFSLVLFLTTEVWQVFSAMPAPFLALVAGLFVALGIVFLAVRLPHEVDELERENRELGPPLRRAQRVNVGLVMFVSQGLQVLFVTVGVGVFFAAFGALAVSTKVLHTWIGSNGHVLLDARLFGHPVEITQEMLRVAGAIAAFSGLYYAIAVLIDSTYRQEFLSEITKQLRDTFTARAEYLKLLQQRPPLPRDSITD